MAVFDEPKKFNVVPGNAADTSKIQDASSTTEPSMSAFFSGDLPGASRAARRITR